ncbi:protein nrt1/ ptr family 2.3, partial [Quercus suber]
GGGRLHAWRQASGGWISNLIVYLIQAFKVKNINAAQISNITNGCTNLLPVIGAIVADSFSGSFSPCDNGSSLCTPLSKLQYAILYTSLALACIGYGGTRFTIATMGANQFNNPKDQGIFFKWFFFTFYIAAVVSTMAIIYIQGNVSWKLGFGLCAIANFIGLAFLLLGNRFYLHDKPQGSPFTSIVRVIVATIQKWKVPHSSEIEDYYYRHDGISDIAATATPKKSFR